jgi:hypothetical protein
MSISSWDEELFPQIQQSTPKLTTAGGNGNGFNFNTRPAAEQTTADPPVEMEKMLDGEWRQQRAKELFRMLQRERGNLEVPKREGGEI